MLEIKCVKPHGMGKRKQHFTRPNSTPAVLIFVIDSADLENYKNCICTILDYYQASYGNQFQSVFLIADVDLSFYSKRMIL